MRPSASAGEPLSSESRAMQPHSSFSGLPMTGKTVSILPDCMDTELMMPGLLANFMASTQCSGEGESIAMRISVFS